MYPKRQSKSDQERFYDAFRKKVGAEPEVYLKRKLASGVAEEELQWRYDLLAVEIARQAHCTALRYEALKPRLNRAADRHREKAANERVPVCPRCGAQMVRRVHQSGLRKGKTFWGCGNYPACRHKQEIGEGK